LRKYTRFPRKREKKEWVKDKWKLFVFACIAMLAVYFYIFSTPNMIVLIQNRMVEMSLKEKIKEQEAIQDSLREEMGIFKGDSATLERYLREKYNYIREGEKIYIERETE